MSDKDDQFTLHRQLWRYYRAFPRLVQIWLAVAVTGALIFEVPSLLSGVSNEQRVRDAVALAAREVTGPDPASSCSALSPAGLGQVVSQFGSALGTQPARETQLAACQRLVVEARGRTTPQQVADFARGSIRTVEFRRDGSALVLYIAADHRLGADLTVSEHGGRWLIDNLSLGSVLGATAGTDGASGGR